MALPLVGRCAAASTPRCPPSARRADRLGTRRVTVAARGRPPRCFPRHGECLTPVPRLPLAVVTVHDLAFLRWPEQVPARRYRYLSAGVESGGRADGGPDHRGLRKHKSGSGRSLVRRSGADRVTQLGVDRSAFARRARGAVELLRARTGIERPYVLAVGNLEPRKNLPALLRAFSRLAPDGRTILSSSAPRDG